VFGYMGRILFVDLDHETYSEEVIDPGILRQFIGGTGLAAYIMWKYPIGKISPNSGENPLIFTTGPLTGTSAPCSGRYAVVAKSPLTGIWGEADSGGKWGVKLKAAGYDGVVITGKAPKPVYLVIKEECIEFRDAAKLWGLDTYETGKILEDDFSDQASVICIGPAGEQQIPIACIMTEGHHGRAAGRCGLGAVMGSKNLKAIVAQGAQKVKVFDKKALQESIRRVVPNIVAKTQKQRKLGTAGGVVGNATLGDASAKNFQIGNWITGAEKIGGEEMIRRFGAGNYHCPSCVIGCGKSVRVTKGKFSGTVTGAPEYETLAGFGVQLMIDDLEAIIEATDLCNRYGLDVISLSVGMAFLFEAVEKEFIKVPSGYPRIEWGNGEAITFLIEETVQKKGLGLFLANGVRWASKQLGPETESFAMHVKGLEFPLHDPRALSSLAVAYATYCRGACHRGCSHQLERFAIPQLGYPSPLDRHVDKGKGIATARMQDYAELYDCLKLCHFMLSGVQISDILEWLNCVTGWDMDLKEFLQVGERSNNLKRLINLSCGITTKDDQLPSRALNEAFPEGNSANYVPNLSEMLAEYYQERGWDEIGRPTKETLIKLGLENYLNNVEKSEVNL
jgi:aldehyde:ferredoxin oxidoreductase